MKLTVNTQTNVEAKLSLVHQCAIENIPEPNLQTEFVIVISELLYNILKYSDGGHVEIMIKDNVIEVYSKDYGQGFSECYEQAFNEGFSTGGSLGLGMSCIIRFFDELLFETSQKGTTFKGYRSFN